jgi:hypothetical protein
MVHPGTPSVSGGSSAAGAETLAARSGVNCIYRRERLSLLLLVCWFEDAARPTPDSTLEVC